MNFILNSLKDIEKNVIEKNNVKINQIIKSLFKNPSRIFYVTNNNKFFGVINKKSVLSANLSNLENIVCKNHPVVEQLDDVETVKKIAHINQTLNIPIVKNQKLIGEYEFKPTQSLFSMDKKRWNILYGKNEIVKNFINFKKFSQIIVIGPFAKTVVKHIKNNCKHIDCTEGKNTFDSFKDYIKSNCTIIDTSEDGEIKKQILNLSKLTKFANLKSQYLTLYDFCNLAELYDFKTKQIQSFFFVFPDANKFKNLSLQERYRIAFDKPYRFYFEHRKNPEILSLIKNVFGDLFSEKFLQSRDELSGLVFQNGICKLTDSSNEFCKASNGTRFTTDKTSFYKHSIYTFGACFVYGAIVDDKHTLASCMQRFVNQDGKDYELLNYGARNLSIFESLRIARTLFLTKFDKLIFVISEEECKFIQKFGFSNIFFLQEFFDSTEIHDFFLDEPIHCNHICTEKIAKFIYDKLKPNLVDKPKLNNTTPIQKENLFKSSLNQMQENVDAYIKYLKKFRVEKENCSIILTHANPFTLGHYKLVEYASKHSEHVFVSVADDDNWFSPKDRYEMAFQSCKKLPNVTVFSARDDLISSKLYLPGYFERDENPHAAGNTSGLLDFIANVLKPALNIKERFLGSEPFDAFTQKMNEESAKILPQYGIKSTEVPRFENANGIPYSGKIVRNALKRKDWDTIRQMVTPETEKILRKYAELM